MLSPFPAGADLELLLKLRWMTLAAMLGGTLGAPLLLELTLPRGALLGVAAAVAAANLASLGSRRVAAWPLGIQLGFDLLAWTLFIFFSGGATNPLISILLPLVASGAALLPERQAWALGLLAVGAYSGLWYWHWPLQIHDEALAVRLHLAGMWLTFAVSVGVTVWFVARMTAAVRDRDQALAATRETALRQDWVLSLGGLAAGTAHELGTPLSTLGTLVEERLRDSDQDPDLRQDLELMALQVRTCKASLGRLAARAGQAWPDGGTPCEAGDWLRGLVHGWRALHPATDLGLDLDPNLATLRLRPDPSLEQALRNLVDNAVTASPTRVDLSAKVQDEALEIRIADQGPGIAAGLAGTLGRPLASPGGMGVGLALTLGTLERHGGRLELTRRPQGGTEARVRLPVARLRAP